MSVRSTYAIRYCAARARGPEAWRVSSKYSVPYENWYTPDIILMMATLSYLYLRTAYSSSYIPPPYEDETSLVRY